MSTYPSGFAQKEGFSMNRRSFLTTVSVSLSGLSFSAQAEFTPDTAQQHGQRAVFQQMPYFNFEQTGEVYQAPRGNHSTREYLSSISQEQFLSRHWFT